MEIDEEAFILIMSTLQSLQVQAAANSVLISKLLMSLRPAELQAIHDSLRNDPSLRKNPRDEQSDIVAYALGIVSAIPNRPEGPARFEVVKGNGEGQP